MSPDLEMTAGQWLYICCHCIVKLGHGTTWSRECDACHNTNLRFMHTLENKEDKRMIEVGIECARLLVDDTDREVPRLAENETKRKEGWRIFHRNPGRCVTTIDDLIEKGKL